MMSGMKVGYLPGTRVQFAVHAGKTAGGKVETVTEWHFGTIEEVLDPVEIQDRYGVPMTGSEMEIAIVRSDGDEVATWLVTPENLRAPDLPDRASLAAVESWLDS